MRTLELLAPARDADTALAAITAGADAIYMGPSSHGARREAANSIDDIRRVIDAAHPFRVKVYATVNTIVYDNEIKSVERLIAQLYQAGVDALIVQDMGILCMDIPPIELHASTQCDIRSVDKARFLADAGFSRLVLARELSRDEINAIHRALPETELEAFIHGALCVSYSGDCRASAVTGGRSANRGECAQICRLPYTLTDAKGNILMRDKHLLSLRDLNRTQSLQEMAEAGVSSFKIEGRLKEPGYVKNTVAWYSRQLDRIIADNPGRYSRQSLGDSRPGFTPDPQKSFNRGFTNYFFSGNAPRNGMANIDTPKSIGQPVATVINCDNRVITAHIDTPLANGDGLAYIDATGLFRGFRLNRVERNKLYPASPQSIPPGTLLYRNRDKEWDDAVNSARSTRTIAVDMALRICGGRTLALEISEPRTGISAVVTSVLDNLTEAVTPQEGPRRQILNKLGTTIFRSRQIADMAGSCFIPASLLANLRREAVAALESAMRATYPYRYRIEDKAGPYFTDKLTQSDNVANRLAREFYNRHGVSSIIPAVEVSTPERGEEVKVMTTRYCIRKELGHCLLTPEGRNWHPGPLFLTNRGVKLRVECDCKRCGMDIFTTRQ